MSVHGGLTEVSGARATDAVPTVPTLEVASVAPPAVARPIGPHEIERSGRRRRRALLLADLIGLTLASAIATVGVSRADDVGALGIVGIALFFAALVLVLWAAVATISGSYRREELRADLTVVDDLGVVVASTSIVCWFVVVLSIVAAIEIPVTVVVGLWAAMTAMVLLARAGARAMVRRQPGYVQKTLIVGAGDVGQLLGRKLVQHPELGLRLVGFVDDSPKSMRRDLSEFSTLGTPDQIRDLVEEHDVDRVVIAFSNERHDRELELVHALRDLDVQIDIVPRLFEAIGPVVRLHYIEGLPLVVLPSVRSTRLGRAVKRIIDVTLSATALVVLSPLFAFIAWRIKRGSSGPVFFRQERLGADMRPFELLKFRTMVVGTDDAPHRDYVRSIMDTTEAPEANRLYKLTRDDAVTSVGWWLRRTSLDELPQLLNVLRGDMSIVGPRPCMQYETDFFEPHHFDRFLVPAGMTGLWQVTARARSTFKEALDLDVAYAHNWSLSLDLRLIVRTPVSVLRSQETT